jgi:transposase-like protein
MAGRYRKFSPEVKDDAVKIVLEGSRPIAQVARELGINEGTLGNWVNQYRHDNAGEAPHSTSANRFDFAKPNGNCESSA